jgi:hypothetical protein
MYSPETLAALGTHDTGQTVGILPVSLDCTFLITPSVSLTLINYQLSVLCLGTQCCQCLWTVHS